MTVLLVASGFAGPFAASQPAFAALDDGISVPGPGLAASTETSATAAAHDAGSVLYRVNVGGPAIEATGTGPAWDPDTPFLVAGGEQTSTPSPPAQLHPSVPSWVPAGIWQYQRWDPTGGEEMRYEFDVQAGQRVEVRLYFYDSYSGTSLVGDRVFDVHVEDQTVPSFDIIERYGDQTGGMLSFDVTSDGTVDVRFSTLVENPQLAAIEVASVEPQPNRLGGRSSVDFGTVVTGDSETRQLTVTNLGTVGDPAITVDGTTVAGDSAFSTGFAGGISLAPGESTDVPVTYSPTSATTATGTLQIGHSGSNAPMSVGLTGTGSLTAPIGFGAAGLSGVTLSNPTSLDFGPDGRLYVTQMTGEILAFDIVRNGENDYSVTDTEVITAVHEIPNHDDDGSYNPNVTTRQVTGITVEGTASTPVIYVTSSDSRVGAGSSQADSGLDTNSGVVSRLTRQADGSWDHVMLVRGLPRSELNHATNDLVYDAANDVLYVGQGGHTNKGAPSDNFALTPEYALSAAILSIDLGQLATMAEKDAAHTTATYLYDLPTLGGTPTPFGGRDGANMATWTAGSPVDVYASGFRNPYDVALAPDGTLYATDNSANPGWGGIVVGEGPAGTCTNEQNEQDEFSPPGLYLVDAGGYYGHPNPTRGNPASTFGAAVENGLHDPANCDYREPGGDSESAALETYGPSPQGMTVYTASNFGGKLQGDLLLAMWNTGSVQRVDLDVTGTAVLSSEPLLEHTGANPLDVTAQGDDDVFPGTVWAATYGSSEITVFEPNDYGGGPGVDCTTADPDSPTYEPLGDADGDGYTNADENAVGTDPCSQASKPADRDQDGSPDSLDDDDDNDGLDDTVDPFAIDPQNGLGTTLPADRQFQPGQHPDSLFGLGFTGVMTNGDQPYSALYDGSKVRAGGAAEKMSIDEVPFGTALGAANSLTYAFQYGVDTPDEPFEVRGTVVTPFSNDMTPQNGQAVGIQLGAGDQDNYLSLSATATDSAGNPTGGVQVVREVGGVAETTTLSEPGVIGSGQTIDLFLTVDPKTDPTPGDGVDHVAVTASYAIDGGQRVTFGQTFGAPAAWFSSTTQGTAVGLISTASGATETFSASWDRLSVVAVAAAPPGDGEVVHRVNAGGSTVAATDGGPAWSADTANAPSQYLAAGGSVSAGLSQPATIDGSVPAGTPAGIWASERWDPGAAPEMRYEFPVQPGATYEVRLYVYDSYFRTSLPGDRVFDVLAEGQPVLTGFDLIGTHGDDTGAVESFTVTATDASLGVEFRHGPANHPQVNAIEVVTVADAPTDGEVVHRVNAAGPTVAATDGGPAWSTDAANAPSQYLVAGGSASTGLSQPSATDGSVPAGTPADIWASERWDPGAAPEMRYEFPVEAGTTYEVRLYVYDSYFRTSLPGDRVFDVLAEGEVVLADLDVVERFGDDTAAMVSFTVTAADASLDIEFRHGPANHPMVNAIEVVTVADAPSQETVLSRVNAAGPVIAANDGGPAWGADTTASPSPHLVAGGSTSTGKPLPGSVHGSVPDGTPAGIWTSERWDPGSAPEMQWRFAAQAGETYEVRLYVYDSYFRTSLPGDRVFDVLAEGEVVLADLDVVERFGDDTAAMVSFRVTPADDTIDLEFRHGPANHPMVNAIEIVRVDSATAAA